MSAISSSVAAIGVANASGSRASGSRSASATPTSSAVLDVTACRNAAKSAADDEPSSFDSEPREQLLVAFVQAGIECVARGIVTAQRAREPQRFASARELARRRRDQQVDDNRDTDRDRDRQPDVQCAGRGFAERREAELVGPKPTIIARIAPTGRSLLADVR